MPHILLIDDDELFRPMLGITLTQLGHQVTEARNGKEGLAALQINPVDLVITDIVMPEMEGIEIILELKRLSPVLPIIAMSGGGRGNAADYLVTARMLGANRSLAKPFSTEELTTAIAEVLNKS